MSDNLWLCSHVIVWEGFLLVLHLALGVHQGGENPKIFLTILYIIRKAMKKIGS